MRVICKLFLLAYLHTDTHTHARTHTHTHLVGTLKVPDPSCVVLLLPHTDLFQLHHTPMVPLCQLT